MKIRKSVIVVIAILFFSIPAKSLTLAELRTQIRLKIKDSNSSRQRYTDSQLNSLINEAHRDVVNETWVILKSTSFVLVSGTTYYALPADTIDIGRLTLDYVPLKETSIQERDAQSLGGWETTGSRPSRYFQDPTQPGYLGFQPFPNSGTSTGTVRMQYFAQANDLSSDSSKPYNSEDRYAPYSDLLIIFPCYKIFLLEGDTARGQFYSQEYESRVQLMRDRVRSRPNFFPGFSGATH